MVIIRGSKFGAKIQNQTEDYFTFVFLLSGCSIDDAEVKINDVLGEGDNITFIVRINESATTFTVRYLFIFLTSSRVDFE